MNDQQRAVAEQLVPWACGRAHKRRIPQHMCEAQDACQDACEGMCRAVASAKGPNVPWRYVRMRMDGAMVDGLRRVSWESRAERSRRTLSGLAPTSVVTSSFEADDDALTSRYTTIEHGFELTELEELMREVLTEREHYVLECRYMLDETQTQTGMRLGVSESRVCQIEKEALAKLRKALTSQN